MMSFDEPRRVMLNQQFSIFKFQVSPVDPSTGLKVNSARGGLTTVEWPSFRRGFTLIELLLVMAIIGILITLVTVTIKPIQAKSRDSRRKADVSLTRSGLDLFKADFKIYPNFTFYLGKNTADSGATQSSLDVASQLNGCSSLPTGRGNLADFASSSDLNSATLFEGFESVNGFMICMKYMEQVVKDPTQVAQDGYQYRVTADYADMIISAKLENPSDQSVESLFNVAGATKRFIDGPGKTSRQLADDSKAFFGNLPGNLDDGLYLYQCINNAGGATINKDDRSSADNQPIVANGSNWVANSVCQNDPNGLAVVQAYGKGN